MKEQSYSQPCIACSILQHETDCVSCEGLDSPWQPSPPFGIPFNSTGKPEKCWQEGIWSGLCVGTHATLTLTYGGCAMA